jgi:hypothetical protein
MGFCASCINAWSGIIRMADHVLTVLGGEAMYQVIKPFDYLGNALAVGDTVALSAPYAAFCLEAGLVKAAATPAPENASDSDAAAKPAAKAKQAKA